MNDFVRLYTHVGVAQFRSALAARLDVVEPAVRVAHHDAPLLTRTEVRLLRLLDQGHSNKALARTLYVSQSTVRTHLRSIYAKLGAGNRTQAVTLGHRFGLTAQNWQERPLAPARPARTTQARATTGEQATLTAKELRLLQLLAEGLSNKAMADRSFVSKNTVRTHLRHIYAKLGVTNRTETVTLCRRQGLIA